jgi:cobalamin biosynthesis protein CobD/CbiB
MAEANGVNAKIAVVITRLVGSMWCAYIFAGIALLGLTPALKPGGEGLIAWIAQTFLQLVLLSVIMVGQNVQSIASDARAEHTYEDTVQILDALDVHTEGGLKTVLDAIHKREA